MSARLVLIALLGDFLLAALAFGVVIPVFEQPDEHTHYYFAQHVAQTGSLPVQAAEQDARGPWEQEGSQPPLYYLLAAPLVRLAGADLAADGLWYNDQNTMGTPALLGNENRFIHDPASEGWPWRGYALGAHLGRLLSSLLGLVTVLSVFLVARRILGGRAWLGIAAAALAAFNPQFLAVSATFGNDALIIALSSLALALLLRIWDQLEAGAGPADLARTVPALAVVAGLAPLAKISGLTLLAFCLATLAWLSWRRRSWTIALATLGPLLLGAALLSGWWYLRNLQLYGDLLGFSRMHPGGTLRQDFRWLDWLRREAFGELKGVWLSSWGLFGWFTILLPAWVYGLISAACALSLAALMRHGRRLSGLDRSRLAWLVFWGLLVLASLLRWLSITKGGQGRLLFPALAAGATLLTAGLAAALAAEPRERDERRLALGLYLTMFLFSAACLFGVIRPAYAAPERISAADLPATALPVGAVFGEGLKLVALERPERVRAGETFPVTLYWQVERALTRDGLVALELSSRQEDGDVIHGTVHVETLAYPGAGSRPPKLLAPGPDLYVDRYQLEAGSGSSHPVEPVGAVLAIRVYDPQAQEPWRRSDDPKKTSSSIDMVIDPQKRVTHAGAPIARFGNGITMMWPEEKRWWFPAQKSVQLTSEDLSMYMSSIAGNETRVVWSVERDQVEDLQVFIHWLDADGKPVQTFDRPLASNASYPSRSWRSGDSLVGSLPWYIVRNGDLAEADYRPGARHSILVGLYRLSDGSRIPAFDPAGQRLKDDAVVLHEIEVVGEPGLTGEPSSGDSSSGDPSANPSDDPASDPAGDPTPDASSDLSSEPTPTPASENAQP